MYGRTLKTICSIATVFALILLATGCGTDRPATEQQAAGTEPAAAQPAAAPRPAAEAKRAAPPAPKVQTVVLEPGTVLKVRTTSTLSTKSIETGQAFEATLEEPVMAGGREVLPKGAAVTGRIVEADPGGRVEGRAMIAVALASIQAGDERIAISTNTLSRQARASTKKDATKIGIGAGIGAAVGAIAGGGKGAAIGAAAGGGAGTASVLATRGEAAVIPAETVLTFQLRAPAKIAVKP